MHEPSQGANAQTVARSVYLAAIGGAIVVMLVVAFFILTGGIDRWIEKLIPAASSFAHDVDGVILLVAGIVGFWFFASLFTFFWLLWRFRHHPGNPKAEYLSTHEHMLHQWVSWPHVLIIVCDLIIIASAVRVWYIVKQTMPPADATVKVTAQQWAWTFVQPGASGQLGTPDDVKTTDELHVEVNKTYHFDLEAKDVVHSFFIPSFRLKQDAVPGRVIQGWFKPTATGSYDILCAQMCGVGHGLMGARVIVETPAEHAAFLAAHRAPNPATPVARTAAAQ
jgi:cytochrome c oxidase subunit 2